MLQEQCKNNSLIHRLNPTLKFISFVFIIVMIFLPLGFFAQTILLVVLLSLFAIAKIKKRVLWNIIKSVIFLFLILFIINWFLYKTPIAINVGDWSVFNSQGILFGKTSWVTNSGFVVSHNNGLLLSQIWGGQVGINGQSFISFDQKTIENILEQNKNITPKIIDNFWIKSFGTDGSKHSVIRELFIRALGNEELAKQYFYLINNSFMFNGIEFQATAVNNAMHASELHDLINNSNLTFNWTQQKAQEFLSTSYYVLNTNWYTLSPLAIQLALFVSIKVFLMILVATILTSTTNSIELTYALENLLSPLKLFKLPVAEASMMIAIALRFIPSLLSESNRIMNAQASRGVDFKNGKFWDKMKAIVSLVVPLFSIAFKKAEELANAMDARSYNPRYARTKYRRFVVNWYDWIAYFCLMLLFGFFVAICKWKLFFSPFNLFELGIIL